MFRKLGLSVLMIAGFSGWLKGQESYPLLDSTDSVPATKISSSTFAELFKSPAEIEMLPVPVSPVPVSPVSVSPVPVSPVPVSPVPVSPYTPVIPWQEKAASGGVAGASGGGESEGGGASAADALNSAVPLAQIQFQNVFVPETYGGSGYANDFIVQPVIPINRNPDAFFPYHIVRPTFPILAPVADPFGPVRDQPGTGDTTVLDAYFHPTEKEGVTWGIGPMYILPTATNPSLLTGERQTGLGEWQLGVVGAVLNASRKDWVTGFLLQTYWSVESDAYTVAFQPIANRLNAIGDCYVGIGDLLWKFGDQNQNYSIPLSLRIGKVITAGKQPINIFLQPEYTPRGLTSQPTSKYGVKLSITFLLPGAEFGYSKKKVKKRACRSGCHHCR